MEQIEDCSESLRIATIGLHQQEIERYKRMKLVDPASVELIDACIMIHQREIELLEAA